MATALEKFEEWFRSKDHKDGIYGLPYNENGDTLADMRLKKLPNSYDEANPEYYDKGVDHDWQMFRNGWLAAQE